MLLLASFCTIFGKYFLSINYFYHFLSTLQFRINVHYVYSFSRLFSTLYAVIWVYMFINFEKKDPTCTFIPAYTIILFTSYNTILSQLNRNQSMIQQPRGSNPIEVLNLMNDDLKCLVYMHL